MADPHATSPGDATGDIHPSRSKVVYFVLIACLPFMAIVIGIAFDSESRQERHRLVHETDHQALLAASRQLMRDYPDRQILDPSQDPRVPLIIRELGPTYMIISAQKLHVELHGGFEHYGFIAHAVDVNADDPWVKLIDGLFYYSTH